MSTVTVCINKHIGNICRSKELLELADNLEQFASCLRAAPAQTELLRMLKNSILAMRFPIRRSACVEYHLFCALYRNEGAVSLFLRHLFKGIAAEGECADSIEALVSHIRENFTSPLLPKIQPKEINDILSHLEKRYSFVSKIYRGVPITIGLLDNTCNSMNSFYLLKILFGVVIDDTIMLTNPIPNFGCTQEHTFLHELGHALHLRLTYDVNTLPVSFIELSDAIFTTPSDATQADLIELFADCFALAASTGTARESGSVLRGLDDERKRIIGQYFHFLLKSYKKNYRGELSLTQISANMRRAGLQRNHVVI